MPNPHKNEMHAAGDVAETPTIRMTRTGKKVGHVTVAVTTGKSTERLRVILWEGLAEKAAALAKGDFVQVVGRLQSRSYNDKTGVTRFVTEVVASQLACPDKEQAAEPITPRGYDAKPNLHGVAVTDDDIPSF